MGVKKTLAELLLAAAALLPIGCDGKTEKETVFVDRWQDPIMNVRAMSSDNRFVGLSFNQDIDVEAFVYDADTKNLVNFSNDSVNSDFPIGFINGHLITRCEAPSGGSEKIKVYDSSGALKFDSGELGSFLRYFPHDASKFLIETEKTDENVYVFDVNSMTLEKVISSAHTSHVRDYSNDCSIIFIMSENGDNKIHMLKSGVLSEVISGDDEYNVERVSNDGKKSIIYSYGLNDMKIFDADTGLLQNVVMPFGSRLSSVCDISQNGLAAVMVLYENNCDNFYHLDIPSGTWRLINQSAMDIFPERLSADGSLVLFYDFSEYASYLLYNSSTQELYSPVADFEYDELVGFTFDNKVIFTGQSSGSTIEEYQVISHNPATKTNTVISDTNYSYGGRVMLLPNREILAIDANENATDERVVVLEDLVAHSKKAIKQQGVDLWLDQISYDGKYLFLNSYGPKDNLFVYRVSDGVLKQITDNPDGWDCWFNVVQDLSSDDAIIFEQRYDNGTKEIKSYKFSTGELTKISN